jgi:hypothetical protein
VFRTFTIDVQCGGRVVNICASQSQWTKDYNIFAYVFSTYVVGRIYKLDCKLVQTINQDFSVCLVLLSKRLDVKLKGEQDSVCLQPQTA